MFTSADTEDTFMTINSFPSYLVLPRALGGGDSRATHVFPCFRVTISMGNDCHSVCNPSVHPHRDSLKKEVPVTPEPCVRFTRFLLNTVNQLIKRTCDRAHARNRARSKSRHVPSSPLTSHRKLTFDPFDRLTRFLFVSKLCVC